MALHEIKTDILDGPHIKSYATEANLRKRLRTDAFLYPEYNDRVMVVRTPKGRWTAVVILDKKVGGYVGRYDGFMTL